MGNVDASVNEMIKLMCDKAPTLKPSIFPTRLLATSQSIAEVICSTPEHVEQLKQWQLLQRSHLGEIAFLTEVDYSQRKIKVVEAKVQCLFHLSKAISYALYLARR